MSDGRWKTYVYEDGRRIQKAYRYDRLVNWLYDFYVGQENRNATMETAFRWLQDYWETVKGSSEQTIYRKRRKWEAMTTAEFASKKVTEAAEEDICRSIREKCAAYEQAHGKRYGMQGIREYLQIVRKVFWIAQKKGAAGGNPAELITADDFRNCAAAAKKTAEEKMIAPEEKDMILEKAREMESGNGNVNIFHAFAAELAVHTGMRAGELASLTWDDVGKDLLHIHTQQLYSGESVGYTKNERGISKDGRYFPITEEITDVLGRVKTAQEEKGIESAFVFVNGKFDGPMDKQSYEAFFRDTLCRPLGIHVSHNHGLRVALNSQEFQEMGLTPAERAYLLGHSVETNERNYSEAGKSLLPGIEKKIAAAKR